MPMSGGFQSSSEYEPMTNLRLVCDGDCDAVGVFVQVADGVMRDVGETVGDTDADTPRETDDVGVGVAVDDGNRPVTLKITALLE